MVWDIVGAAVKGQLWYPYAFVLCVFFFTTDNEIDGPTLLKVTERMSERLFPKMKDQVKFMSALDKLKL